MHPLRMIIYANAISIQAVVHVSFGDGKFIGRGFSNVCYLVMECKLSVLATGVPVTQVVG